jgi:hypothetical protein
VYDNRTLQPVNGVKVEVFFPESREEQEVSSARDGSFRIESDGHWRWIIFFWGEDSKQTPVELRLEHPEYDREFIDDLKVGENDDTGRVLDAGFLYLDPKR